jgi:hypothetical protein
MGVHSIDLDHKSVNKFCPLKSNSEDSTHNGLKLVTRGSQFHQIKLTEAVFCRKFNSIVPNTQKLVLCSSRDGNPCNYENNVVW